MPDATANTTLAILAGGEGSRMGRPKGLLTLDGQPILKHILDHALWRGPTLLITSPGRQSPPAADAFDAEATDPVAGLGPMRGILTALQHAKTDQIVVSAVDMPSINFEIFHWLADELHRRPEAHAVMIERIGNTDRIVEPLPAAFRKTAIHSLERRLADGNSALHELAMLPDVYVLQAPNDWAPELWTNLNVPDDLAKWKSTTREL